MRSADLDPLRVPPVCSTEQGPDPRDENHEGERFGEVVVSPGVEALGFVVLAVLGSEHDDRGLVPGGAQGCADPVAVDAGQHDVEHDEVVGVLGCQVEPESSVERDVHVETLCAQTLLQGTGEPALVLDHQQTHVGTMSRPT